MTFALNRMIRFSLRFASHQPNQTKPNRKNNEYYFKHVLTQLHSPRIISFDSIFSLLHILIPFHLFQFISSDEYISLSNASNTLF